LAFAYKPGHKGNLVTRQAAQKLCHWVNLSALYHIKPVWQMFS